MGISHQNRVVSRASRAFSAIELIVVMLVLLLLIAILIPSVGHARESSKTAACSSNMRQIGHAVQLFSQDNDGRGPGYAVRATPAALYSWAHILDAEVFGRTGFAYAIGPAADNPSAKTLSCPKFEAASARYCYGMNLEVTESNTIPDDPARRTTGYYTANDTLPSGMKIGDAYSYQGAGNTYRLGAKLAAFPPTQILLGEKHSKVDPTRLTDGVKGDDLPMVFNRDASPPDPDEPLYASYRAGPPASVGDYILRHPYYQRTNVLRFDYSVEMLSPVEIVESKRYSPE
jgi:type II secretory pathway pseudopilin PulG